MSIEFIAKHTISEILEQVPQSGVQPGETILLDAAKLTKAGTTLSVTPFDEPPGVKLELPSGVVLAFTNIIPPGETFWEHLIDDPSEVPLSAVGILTLRNLIKMAAHKLAVVPGLVSGEDSAPAKAKVDPKFPVAADPVQLAEVPGVGFPAKGTSPSSVYYTVGVATGKLAVAARVVLEQPADLYKVSLRVEVCAPAIDVSDWIGDAVMHFTHTGLTQGDSHGHTYWSMHVHAVDVMMVKKIIGSFLFSMPVAMDQIVDSVDWLIPEEGVTHANTA